MGIENKVANNVMIRRIRESFVPNRCSLRSIYGSIGMIYFLIYSNVSDFPRRIGFCEKTTLTYLLGKNKKKKDKARCRIVKKLQKINGNDGETKWSRKHHREVEEKR